MTFTVLTGLNTDYDVFLVAGIRKMRALGASNDDAIVSGLRSNGGVITTKFRPCSTSQSGDPGPGTPRKGTENSF